MANRNTRNARLLLGTTFAAANMRIINKTHGLKLSLGTDFAKSTGHGDTFETYTAGIADFKADVDRWYDDVDSFMTDAAANKTVLCFVIYQDYSDTANYWAGTCFLNLKDEDLSLGNTVKQSYELVNAGGTAFTHKP